MRRGAFQAFVFVFALAFMLLGAPHAARAETSDIGRSDERPDSESSARPSARPLLRAFAAGGASYGEVFGIGLTSGRIEGGVVIDASRRLGITIGAGHEAGETGFGLSAGDVHLYSTFDVILGRFRAGIGPEISYLWMTRPRSSSVGRNIDAVGTGMRLHASVDLLPFDHGRAVFVTTTAGAGWLRGLPDFFDVERGAIAWRVGAAAGARF